jgi:hypothetical protein
VGERKKCYILRGRVLEFFRNSEQGRVAQVGAMWMMCYVLMLMILDMQVVGNKWYNKGSKRRRFTHTKIHFMAVTYIGEYNILLISDLNTAWVSCECFLFTSPKSSENTSKVCIHWVARLVIKAIEKRTSVCLGLA